MKILFALFVVASAVFEVSAPTITRITPRVVAGGYFDVMVEVPEGFSKGLTLRFYRAEGGRRTRVQKEIVDIRDDGESDHELTEKNVIWCRVRTCDKWLRLPPRQHEDQSYLVVLLVTERDSLPEPEPEEGKPVRVGLPPGFPLDDAGLMWFHIEQLGKTVKTVKEIQQDKTRQAEFKEGMLSLKASSYEQATITFDVLVINKEMVTDIDEKELVSSTLVAQLETTKKDVEQSWKAAQSIENEEEKGSILSKLTGLLEEIANVKNLIKR